MSRLVVYSLSVMFIIAVIYFLSPTNADDVKENFFFTVSKCNPKCSGAYIGKPATFQFDQIKQDGVSCANDSCPSYGMIRGCPMARTYGDGYAPYRYRCAEGVC